MASEMMLNYFILLIVKGGLKIMEKNITIGIAIALIFSIISLTFSGLAYFGNDVTDISGIQEDIKTIEENSKDADIELYSDISDVNINLIKKINEIDFDEDDYEDLIDDIDDNEDDINDIEDIQSDIQLDINSIQVFNACIKTSNNFTELSIC